MRSDYRVDAMCPPEGRQQDQPRVFLTLRRGWLAQSASEGEPDGVTAVRFKDLSQRGKVSVLTATVRGVSILKR